MRHLAFRTLYTIQTNAELPQVFSVILQMSILFTPNATNFLGILMILSGARSLLTRRLMI